MREQILIYRSALAKLDELGIEYTIMEREHQLMGFFSRSTNFTEISSCDQDDIIRTAEQAIAEGAKGIDVEIESGRDCRDYRCYTYISSSITNNNYPEYSVEDMLEYIKELELGD